MSADLIRVLVAADHNLIRRGLEMMLSGFTDIQMVGEARKGGEVLEFCRQNPVDVILMDLFIEEDDCVTTIAAIHKRHSSIRVIVLVNFDEYARVQQALAAGAAGILIKNTENNQLAATIWQVHKSRRQVSLERLDNLMHTHLPQPQPARGLGHDLTEREIKILTLIAHGASNAHIAREMLVSRATVKTHVSSILSKLGAATRTEAAALAIHLGLVSISMPALANEPGARQPEMTAVGEGGDSGGNGKSQSLKVSETPLAPAGKREARNLEGLEHAMRLDPSGQAVVSADERIFIYANQAYRALTPHPEIDPTGQPFEWVWPGEEGQAQWQIIQGVLIQEGEAHMQRYGLHLADASLHFFTFHVFSTEWNGRPAAFLVWWDVTEIVQNEAVLDDSGRL
jgi:two-component system, NarL family, response regulator LiaR